MADELVAWGYVILLVDSYQRVGIDHACTSSAFATFLGADRMPTGLSSSWLAKRFVDRHRVAAVGFSAGARVTLSVAEFNAFEQFVPPAATCGSGRRLRSILHVKPASGTSGDTHAHLIGALDDWTPCQRIRSDKVSQLAATAERPIELIDVVHGVRTMMIL